MRHVRTVKRMLLCFCGSEGILLEDAASRPLYKKCMGDTFQLWLPRLPARQDYRAGANADSDACPLGIEG